MFGSKIFFFFCLALALGIVLGLFSLEAILVVSVFLIFVLFKNKKLLLFILLGLALGFLRSYFFIDQTEVLEFRNKEVELAGFVTRDIQEERAVLEIKKIGTQAIDEKILVYSKDFDFQYQDQLKLTGEIVEPPVFDDFDYKSYLKRKGIFALVYEPRIEKLSSRESFYKKILNLREKLSLRIEQNYPGDQSQLLKAMLLGKKSELSKELKEKLNFSGLRHLTAISGLHTVILINALMYLFLAMGLWRKQALLATAVFIFVFLMLTGFQVSTIRASIMASILLLAQVIGRMNNAIKAIVLTALIMLLFNPNLLFDVGFELSFLAVLGINYLFPIFNSYFKRIPKTVRSILVMTLSAQLFTLPILIYNFGYVSLIAPITNLLILPILPFVLILGFLSLFLGITFVIPTHILLTYLIKVSEIFSSFAFSSINLRFSLLLCIVYYLFLIYFTYSYRKKNRFRAVDPLTN